MKKIILILLVVLNLVSTFPVFALEGNNKLVISAPSINFTTLKTTTNKLIEEAIAKIDIAIASINKMQNIDSSTKNIVITSLTKLKNELMVYQQKLNAATTLEEMIAINKELVQYLKDNKSAIKDAMSQAFFAIASTSLTSAQEYLSQAEELLKYLKLVCPSQVNLINQTITLTNQLADELYVLDQAIANQNVTEAKTSMKKITELTKSIYTNLETLTINCSL